MMRIDWQQLGQGVGWLGGILYLISVAELRARRWIYEHRPEWHGGPRRIPGMIPAGMTTTTTTEPPRVHQVLCGRCGKNVALSPFGCEHPDAKPAQLVHAAACTCPACLDEAERKHLVRGQSPKRKPTNR